MTVDQFQVSRWSDYQGQLELKIRLAVHIDSARERDAPIDHILLAGPPGYGKTTLGGLIAARRGVDYNPYVMPLDDRTLYNAVRFSTGILALDEIHQLGKGGQHQLLTLLEEGYIQTKQGRRAESKDLTVIGMTTEPGKLIQPLYDRFMIKPKFEPYSDVEMEAITRGMMMRSGLPLDEELVTALAGASNGVPRQARTMIIMARDLFVGDHEPTPELVLSMCNMTYDGLTHNHVAYLQFLRSQGGLAGRDAFAEYLNLGKSLIEDMERTFIRRGWIERTPRGRELTSPGADRVKEFEDREERMNDQTKGEQQ